MNDFNIELIISELKKERKVFASEKDFQFEIAFIIKNKYPSATVILEYRPDFAEKIFNNNMYIDILVIYNGKWIPIELKYKTKKCNITLLEKNNKIKYNLEDHNCITDIRYYYLKDIERIEKVRNKLEKNNLFEKGYTIFITNNTNIYDKKYPLISLHNGSNINSLNTKKYTTKKLDIKGNYDIKWNTFYDGTGATIENTNDNNTKIFKYLVNEIRVIKK